MGQQMNELVECLNICGLSCGEGLLFRLSQTSIALVVLCIKQVNSSISRLFSLTQLDLASELGFIFFQSEDGSLEKTSTIPRGYYGYVLNPHKGKFPSGYRGYHGQQAIDRTDL